MGKPNTYKITTYALVAGNTPEEAMESLREELETLVAGDTNSVISILLPADGIVQIH